MLSFPSQNDKKEIFPTGRVYLKARTQVTVNQHIFMSSLTKFLASQFLQLFFQFNCLKILCICVFTFFNK